VRSTGDNYAQSIHLNPQGSVACSRMVDEDRLEKQAPENCEVGEWVSVAAVPHWSSATKLVEFFPRSLTAFAPPWIFAQQIRDDEIVGWKRVE
jgi:hypothetical protein